MTRAKAAKAAKAQPAQFKDEDFGALLVEQARERMDARETKIAQRITAEVLMAIARISSETERPREPGDVILVGMMEALSHCVRVYGIGQGEEAKRLN